MAAVNGRAMKAKGSAFEREVVAFLRANGHQPCAAVVAKRRGKPVGDSYVVLDLDTFARLLADDS